MKKLIPILIVSFLFVGIAKADTVTISSKAAQNLDFYSELFQLSVSDMASKILSEFSSPHNKVSWDNTLVSSPNVSISIIQHISNNPDTYRLVRNLATSTPNKGTFAWITSDEIENGPDMYVEVGCTFTSQACQAFSLIPNP